jgi:hypothetical protein
MSDFRHPAVFFLTRHPFLFLACDFFQLDFVAEVGALAKEGVEPAKNIRPVRSATIIIKVFGMIIQFHQLVPGGGQPCRGSLRGYLLLFTFLCHAYEEQNKEKA